MVFHSAIRSRSMFSTLLFTQNLSDDTFLFIRFHFMLLTFYESFDAVSQVWNELNLFTCACGHTPSSAGWESCSTLTHLCGVPPHNDPPAFQVRSFLLKLSAKSDAHIQPGQRLQFYNEHRQTHTTRKRSWNWNQADVKSPSKLQIWQTHQLIRIWGYKLRNKTLLPWCFFSRNDSWFFVFLVQKSEFTKCAKSVSGVLLSTMIMKVHFVGTRKDAVWTRLSSRPVDSFAAPVKRLASSHCAPQRDGPWAEIGQQSRKWTGSDVPAPFTFTPVWGTVSWSVMVHLRESLILFMNIMLGVS